MRKTDYTHTYPHPHTCMYCSYTICMREITNTHTHIHSTYIYISRIRNENNKINASRICSKTFHITRDFRQEFSLTLNLYNFISICI